MVRKRHVLKGLSITFLTVVIAISLAVGGVSADEHDDVLEITVGEDSELEDSIIELNNGAAVGIEHTDELHLNDGVIIQTYGPEIYDGGFVEFTDEDESATLTVEDRDGGEYLVELYDISFEDNEESQTFSAKMSYETVEKPSILATGVENDYATFIILTFMFTALILSVGVVSAYYFSLEPEDIGIGKE